MAKSSRLVYSTDSGRICPNCEHALEQCQCKQQQAPVSSDGIVRIRRETKGRKGKGVSLIEGLPLAPEALTTLAKQLKKKCGCGGTAKNGVIEIQGDYRQLLLVELEKLGYKVKLAGG